MNPVDGQEDKSLAIVPIFDRRLISEEVRFTIPGARARRTAVGIIVI